MRTTEVAMIGVCAALYAVIGRLTDLGVVAPTVGVVAFWPAAVIPAIFAVLYGPWTGGTGAAIGIFIRDMLFHGNALLSLSAGVTANFFAFALLGYLARKDIHWKKISISSSFVMIAVFASLLLFSLPVFNASLFSGPWYASGGSGYVNGALNSLCFLIYLLILVWIALRVRLEGGVSRFLGVLAAIIIIGLSIFVPLWFLPPGTGITGLTPFDSMLLFVGISAGSILIVTAVSYFWPEWKRYGIACVVSLWVGSTIIGCVLWFYSQFLPLTGGFMYAPTYFILLWIVWTFATEIPFLILVGPPVIKAVYRAFPSLRPQSEKESS